MAWYVVYCGQVLGVYQCWAKCNAQVSGFSNNYFRGFVTIEEAEASYLEFISS
jgi:viroplasmin and RNaseH domain-containing protein